jgi:tetratricopeptide (TPR) repeat protein
VSGDLDAIVLKAMRRDPAERYASIELFDADILAHLERRPVKARAGTWRYLAGRFAARHKLPLATAAAILVTLLAGLVMAERERNVAVAEKARAERHFASVRKLANTFIFEVHGEIEKLEGALKAREMLVKTSLEYLDALAAEGGRDPALTFEIASAYRRIATVQGEPGVANRGDPKAALANNEKARALFMELEAAKPDDLEILREHRRLRYALFRGYFEFDDSRWKTEIAELHRLSRRLAAHPGATVTDRAHVPISGAEEAHLTAITSGRTPATDALINDSIAKLERLIKEAPAEAFLQDALAGMELRAGILLARADPMGPDYESSIAHITRAVAITRERRKAEPDAWTRLGAELEAISILAKVQEIAGRYREADATIAEAAKIGAALHAREPGNVNLANDHMNVLAVSAEIALRLGEPARAVRLCREAMQIAARLPPESLASRAVAWNLINVKGRLGIGLLGVAQSAGGDRSQRLAMLLEAKSLLDETQAFVDDVKARNIGTIEPADLEALAAARKGVAQALAGIKSS